MRETTVKFKRGMFTALFSCVALICVHPFTARYPSLGIAAFAGGACAFVGTQPASCLFRP
ncbi:hypothetical protein M3I54_03080 [Paraburkholderia sp. CNPSo 3274]|uniref:hypothetical protein n=1 Tax=Paraburkholderia sp. CNPSo 3274 TaxID=2940932 RepID=UPI0020B67EB4|nr:hypothetical protein [Paraburkholderia sp. CNPSo 3274]MCP3705979.1 hypothetical protein [Paraburkholderia sp. CNPSo 3274]